MLLTADETKELTKLEKANLDGEGNPHPTASKKALDRITFLRDRQAALTLPSRGQVPVKIGGRTIMMDRTNAPQS